MNYYKRYNRTVSKEFRELILRTYPDMKRRVLLAPDAASAAKDYHSVLLPRNMVWALANDKSHRRGSSWWIDLYTRLTGIQVKTTDHNRWDSKPRGDSRF